MLFNSLEFAVFFPVVFSLYWFLLNKNLKLQNFFLIITGLIFYGWWDWRFLTLLIFTSSVDFFSALQIERSTEQSRRKRFLWLSMSFNLGLLGFFKYYNFFSDSFADLLRSVGFHVNPYSLNIILPVGISFYTFQSMSYCIDVYRGKLKPTRDPLAFYAFVSFFPQLLAGPIERAVNMLPQFYKQRKFSFSSGAEGLRLILWGFYKKIVIADNCSIFVDHIFSNYDTANGYELILGTVFFAFQIYGDFSGYSDIARGLARMLGFQLMINFQTPYFARDIAEFWRRWHISLTTWFRDYVYIPLGGSKAGKVKAIRNTVIVFLISGLWHGANWTFVTWGALNALYFLPLLLFDKNRSNLTWSTGIPTIKEIAQILLTFSLTCFAWIFFRSDSISSAFHYIGNILTADYSVFSVSGFKFYFPIILIFFVLIDWATKDIGLNEKIANFNRPAFGIIFDLSIIFLIVLFGSFNEQSFIYFQF